MDVRDGEQDAHRPFGGDTASFYARYRRGYPPEFIAHLAARARGGGGRVLDLGCGTGTLACALAPLFECVVAIDPEPEMLREAERSAHEHRIANVEWIRGSSTDLEELEPILGRFDLVTIGTAFHFMEPRATLSSLRRLTSGGVVAVAYNGTPMWLHPDPWIAPGFVDPAAAPDDTPGPEGFNRLVTRVKEAFPDFHVTIEEMLVGERNSVVSRFYWEGTHAGPFAERPATGRRVRVRGLCVDLWEDGKLVEEWELTDRAGLLEQLDS